MADISWELLDIACMVLKKYQSVKVENKIDFQYFLIINTFNVNISSEIISTE